MQIIEDSTERENSRKAQKRGEKMIQETAMRYTERVLTDGGSRKEITTGWDSGRGGTTKQNKQITIEEARTRNSVWYTVT